MVLELCKVISGVMISCQQLVESSHELGKWSTNRIVLRYRPYCGLRKVVPESYKTSPRLFLLPLLHALCLDSGWFQDVNVVYISF